MVTKPGRGRIPARDDRRAIGRGGPCRVPTSVGPERLGVDLTLRIADPRRVRRAGPAASTIAGRARRSIAMRRRGLLACSRDSGQHLRLDSSNLGPLGPAGIARDVLVAPDDYAPRRGRGGEGPSLIDSDRAPAPLMVLPSLTSRDAVGRFAFALAAIADAPAGTSADLLPARTPGRGPRSPAIRRDRRVPQRDGPWSVDGAPTHRFVVCTLSNDPPIEIFVIPLQSGESPCAPLETDSR